MKTKKTKAKKMAILKRKLLRLWSIKVRKEWGNECAVCESKEHLNSHHLIPKEMKDSALRYDLKNGVCLCAKCHKYRYDINGGFGSPHKNPLVFFNWLRTMYPSIYEYCLDNANEVIKYTYEELKEIEEYLK